MDLNKLDPQKAIIENKLVQKWKDVLDFESDTFKPVRGSKKRKNLAMVLEAQERYLAGQESPMLNEATAWGSSSLDTTGAESRKTDGVFQQVAIPLVRRSFPELIGNDIVGVQPMTGPVGIAFALRYMAGQAYGDYTAGNAEIAHPTDTPDDTYSGSHVTSAGEALGSNATGDVGLGVGDGTAIKEIQLTVEKKEVIAKTRKLRARWSIEVAQDLRAMHGVDIDAEMMDVLSYEITAEIDREIIDSIRTICTVASNTSGSWNYSDADGRWQAEKYRTLYHHIVAKANNIGVTTRRGVGNWIVCDPTTCAALESLSNFTVWNVPGDVNTAQVGVSKVGSLDGRLMVYRDTFQTTPEVIVGYKGPSEYDAGVIYMPYVSLMAMRATFEDSFQPSLGLMNRYGLLNHIFGASNYYRQIKVLNLPNE